MYAWLISITAVVVGGLFINRYRNIIIPVMMSLGKMNKTSSFVVNDNDSSATISYNRLGNEYFLSVPYRRDLIVPMKSLMVELIMSDGRKIEITQQSGIPYLVTSEDLGGLAIRVTNVMNSETKDYVSVAPKYCEEVLE